MKNYITFFSRIIFFFAFIQTTNTIAITKKFSFKTIHCKELTEIVEQSGFSEKITFIEVDITDSFGASEQVFYKLSASSELINKFVNVISIHPKYANPTKIKALSSAILHEIGHLQHRHYSQEKMFSKGFNIGYLCMFVQSLLLPKKLIEKYKLGILTLITGMVLKIFFENKLSREHEYEADSFMIKKSTLEQLEEVLEFFVEMQNQELQYKLVHTFLTHPSTESRIQRIRDRIAELKAIGRQ